MSISNEDLQRLIAASEQYYKEIEGFSEADVTVATRVMGMVILTLWVNELPIYAPKFPVVLRVLANTLEQIQELKKKEDK